jgi:two-component system sensor kinase FixL
MVNTAKPLRIAIVTDRETGPECRAVSLPFSLEGYPPLEIEIFRVTPGSGPGAQIAGLQPESFDLILDELGEAAGRGLFPTRPANLTTGALVQVLEQLVCQREELFHKQEINAGIINSATDAVVTITEDHVIVGYNQGAEQIFGYSRQEALGQDLNILIPPPHRDYHREYVRRYVATREARVIGQHVRLTALRRDGSEFPMSISFSVAEIGGNLYFTGIIRDITSYKEMEVRMLQSERLAAVGETVTRITHEIKNPLAIIGGFARQLSRVSGLDDKAQQKLAIIAEEVKRLEGLMAEMRDFTRPPEAKKSRGAIEPVVNEVLELFKDTLEEHHIEVRRLMEGPLPDVYFDPKQITQVLVNLFKNALEAMPRGGALSVACRVKGPNLEISVTDTGEGMSPEVASHIFQPYYTTKEKGSGLGLAICQFIVKEQHGGGLDVQSEPGQGSTFTIQLPLETPV